ncbi:hypothetical protein [Neptuniibacter sp. QD37_11]|uniref:hypothetical protein n=1 Tax=Neptuniibacter sp. QD37_11 TaxID=3398209 RepID=UPI0039F46C87
MSWLLFAGKKGSGPYAADHIQSRTDLQRLRGEAVAERNVKAAVRAMALPVIQNNDNT